MICFEHAIEYDGVDTLMCPQCEKDICEQHDSMIREGDEKLKVPVAIITVGISCSGKIDLLRKYVVV